MKKPKVTRRDRSLLDRSLWKLEGKKLFSIQATVRTVTLLINHETEQTLIDCEVHILHHDFISTKLPVDFAKEEAQSFLQGFETASVRIDIKERLSDDIRVLTLNRVEDVELFVHTPNPKPDGKYVYFEGQLDVQYESLFAHFSELAVNTPNRLPRWGNFNNK